MSTTDDPIRSLARKGPGRSWPRLDGKFRWTTGQFLRLDELGFFEGHRVELIEGMIFEMTAYPPHTTSSMLISQVLRTIFGQGWLVREAHVINLGRGSLPEPDIAVVRGSIRDFSTDHPTTAELIVEVSDATLRKDRAIKSHLYARAGIADYWIVNLVDRQLEVRRGPGADPARKGRYRYAEVTVVPAAGSMAPLAAPGSLIAVADLLP